MAKICGDCEKCSYESGFENGRVFERYRCSVTGQVNDPDHPCDVPEKPRLCEVLGVDVGERFYLRDPKGDLDRVEVYIDDVGRLRQPGNGSWPIGFSWLIEAINHPDRIERIPRLTPEEVQRCRVFGAKWVSRDGDGERVDLWEGKPEKAGGVWMGARIANSWNRFFPSVQPGQLVQVEDEPSEGAVGQ